MLLRGKSIVVTGAGSGLGRSAAIAFSKEGAKITVLDLDEAAAKCTADKIIAEGGEAMYQKVNVADKGRFLELAKQQLIHLAALMFG